MLVRETSREGDLGMGGLKPLSRNALKYLH